MLKFQEDTERYRIKYKVNNISTGAESWNDTIVKAKTEEQARQKLVIAFKTVKTKKLEMEIIKISPLKILAEYDEN